MTAPKIVALAGSLRKDSYNKRLVKIAAEGARKAGAEVTFLDLRDYPLPVFDEDLEAEGTPENALKLKEFLLAQQGLLISAPEYNSSITAALKNVLDWVSRPIPGKPRLACYVDKVAGIMAASPGALGGLRGLVHVRAILSNVGVLVLPEQTAIPLAHEAFDDHGNLKDPAKQKEVEAIGAKLARTIARLSGG